MKSDNGSQTWCSLAAEFENLDLTKKAILRSHHDYLMFPSLLSIAHAILNIKMKYVPVGCPPVMESSPNPSFNGLAAKDY